MSEVSSRSPWPPYLVVTIFIFWLSSALWQVQLGSSAGIMSSGKSGGASAYSVLISGTRVTVCFESLSKYVPMALSVLLLQTLNTIAVNLMIYSNYHSCDMPGPLCLHHIFRIWYFVWVLLPIVCGDNGLWLSLWRRLGFVNIIYPTWMPKFMVAVKYALLVMTGGSRFNNTVAILTIRMQYLSFPHTEGAVSWRRY